MLEQLGAETTFAVAAGGLDEVDLDFSQEVSSRALCDALLDSLIAMASRSKRRQADLSAVLQRSSIQAAPAQVRQALIDLQAEGCVREIISLYDGGTLVTVTNLGMDRPGRNAHWAFLDRLGQAPSSGS